MSQAIETSETSPIQVAFVNSDILKLPGRIGLTIAPGKKGVGLNVQWKRNLDIDLNRLKQEYQTDLLVCLLVKAELETAKITDLLPRAETMGMKTIWFPIVDLGIPCSIADFTTFIEVLLDAVRAGQTVVTHCRGGLGRTGTVVACCLVRLGYEPSEAIRLVRTVQAGAIETKEQQKFVTLCQRIWNSDRREILQDQSSKYSQ
ncbi:cyclin-dependent kinase inhibitor 3 family protein [Floridanema evergladense]|uniref:protein-tyrosine-phosphatase n=1 Tax=Floridaenema evergladense BLCC-F167 TaxID=3153639 RepID=A0ABV4WQ64_9CYAN